MKLRRNMKKRKSIKRFVSLALALCMTISLGSPYVAAEASDAGMASHVHSEECYAKEFACAVGEHEEHGEDCYENVLACTRETAENPAERMTVSGSDAGTVVSPEDFSDLPSLEELTGNPADAVGATMFSLMTESTVEEQYWFYAYYVNQDDPYDVTMKDNFNLKYQMEFHASENYDIGQVVIKIQAELFKDRNGESVTPTEIGVPYGTKEKPQSVRSTPFNYYYDNDGTLVFFNYKPITSGTNAAWQVLYKDQILMDMIDGSWWELNPQISVDEGKSYKEDIPSLTGRIDSWVRLDSVEKSYYSKSGLNYTPGLYTFSQVMEYIDSDMDNRVMDFVKGNKLNTSDWRFVVWDVKVKGTATQPWNMVIKESPGSEGIVVGYKDNSDAATDYKLPIGPVDLTSGMTLAEQREESWGNRFYVVTAYPAAQVKDGDKVSNDIMIELVPVDGEDPSEEKAARTATWTYKDYDWHYSGNIIGVQKETDKTKYTGWLNVYKLSAEKNEDYGDMPFTTTGHMYGYSYTHRTVSVSEENGSEQYIVGDYIPNTYYTLTTVDDFMYLNAGVGEDVMMNQEDYYFSGVTIRQTDFGYDVWEDERVDSQLTKVAKESLPDVFTKNGEVKSEVRIYAMLANPSDENRAKADEQGWVQIDTVYMSDSGRMEDYEFSNEVIAQKPWRVKVEHDTIDYETICEIKVKVCIKSDSAKMKKILEERDNADTNEKSPEIKFENVSGVLGRVNQAGTITYLTETDGNHGSANYSEPGLAEATKELYQNEDDKEILLIRDNAYRTVTWLNETAASFKNAKSINDVNNNRVLVDYYLTAYDGYEIYNKESLNYLREEDQKLISPGRSHVVFYDLLPYGMQFDASYPITAGRVTNLSNNTYQTQPKSWDGTQVTVTVDPERDIITNYRGTGRTMVAFHIAFSGADSTSYTNKKWIEGWGVSFRAYYDWKDIDQLNEVEINANLCAFMPDFSEQSGGSNNSHPALAGLKSEVDYDNGMFVGGEDAGSAYADMVKEYTDENGQTVKGNIDGYNPVVKDGISFDDAYRNVLYAKNVLTDDVATSSESKIEKLVRADSNRFGTFDRSAVVPVGTGKDGFYTYDITVTTATGISDIVIFDRLEQAATDRKDTGGDPFASEFKDGLKTWSGTFRSLDTTGLDKQGITYTAYYSNRADVLISQKGEDPEGILTKENGWYTEEEFVIMLQEKDGGNHTGDWQSHVKALAVRLDSKDGEAYKLEPNSSVSFRINMTAPLVEQLEEGTSLSTYNNASFSSVAVNTSERSTVIGNSVKVTISNEETLEIIKETSGTVPASREDERFEFRLYEEYVYNGVTEKQYLAYTEYKLYKLSDGDWQSQEGLYATDGSGYLYLHADEKAVFEMADAGRIKVEETENVFWESKVTEQEKEEDGKTIRQLTVTNTYRPVLYMQKNLSAVPEGVDVSDESFTFKIEIKRNNNYVPLANAEFWYVDSVRLDGGIPGKLNSGTTGADGTFTIKKDDIVALFPGVAGTEFRVSEVINDEGDEETEAPWNWICETDSVSGTMTASGVSRSITNYYKWKDLLLTKDITHQTQEDYNMAPQPFTFRICEVGKDENGDEILIPMAGKVWELLGEAGNEDAGTEGGSVSGEGTYQTSGVLDEEGKFTCVMGFRTVRIKGLEAGKTYRIVELTDGIGEVNGQPLYVPADGYETDTTMPVYSTRRDVTITNDYQKRPLTVTKTVVGSSNHEGNREKYFRFIVFVNGEAMPAGTPYIVTKIGSEDVSRVIDESGYFILADGETAVFKDAGMLDDTIVVREIDNENQIYPQNQGEYNEVLSGDGVEVSFVNGDEGSLLISKEYMGLDPIGRKAVDFLRENGTWIERLEGSRDNGAVEFILTITDDKGSYVWPETPVTIECIEPDGSIGYRSYEPGQSITVEPWVTLIIPTGEGTTIPSDATYTLIETEESRNQIIKFYDQDNNGMQRLISFGSGEYWLQISQSSASDALAQPETVLARPSATICNEVSSIGDDWEGSIRGKVMTSASEEVPVGKKLVWRVEQYDRESGAWFPAEGVPYVIFCSNGEEKEPVSKEVEFTKGDGRITLYKIEGDVYPQVWFPKDMVYLNLYTQADIDDFLVWLEEGKELLRLVEVLEESDDEWGMLAGYQGGGILSGAGQEAISFAVRTSITMNEFVGQQRGIAGGGSSGDWGLISGPDYSLNIPPMFAQNFVNSNSKTSLEIEKYMAGSSDTLFTMILEQVVSTTSEVYYTPITKDDYQDRIIATKPGAGIPYIIHNADGSIAGSSVTGSGGEIQLEAGQYASLEVSDGTMWLVSEKTAATPNYRLKDLQPESGDVRLTKLNDNLMLITLPEKRLTVQYRVEWYLNDGTLLDSETRVGYVGSRVAVTESDREFKKNEGYTYCEYDERQRVSTILAANSDNTLKLYFDQKVTYRVEWYDINGNTPIITAESRTGNVGDEVSATFDDKNVERYGFDESFEGNVQTITLESGKENVLKLYFRKKVTCRITVIREYYMGDTKVSNATGRVKDYDGLEGEIITGEDLIEKIGNNDWYQCTVEGQKYDFSLSENVAITLTEGSISIILKFTLNDFIVKYSDGVPGLTVFGDDIHTDIKAGDATPEFKGELKRDGYEFTGWSPDVEPTISWDNATYDKDEKVYVIEYVATWEETQ